MRLNKIQDFFFFADLIRQKITSQFRFYIICITITSIEPTLICFASSITIFISDPRIRATWRAIILIWSPIWPKCISTTFCLFVWKMMNKKKLLKQWNEKGKNERKNEKRNTYHHRHLHHHLLHVRLRWHNRLKKYEKKKLEKENKKQN